MRKSTGFTLIEVMVCMAIIAILAALVFSTLRSTMSQTKETVCISNLRQIHAALELYRSDFGEYPPGAETLPAFRSYLGGKSLICPVASIAQAGVPPEQTVNYFIHAFYPPIIPGFEEDRDCMAERGPSYPIAHDMNHIATRVAYSAGRAFYIVLRADGSVTRIPRSSMDRFTVNPVGFPCPRAHHWSNF